MMIFKKIPANIGDILKISDAMSLRFEKISDDLRPVWHEIPAVPGNKVYEEGSFVSVTPDVWFVYESGQWRMMTIDEHEEADRQTQSDNSIAE